MSLWCWGRVLVSYTRDTRFEPLYKIILFLSLDSLNSVKSFRKNSNDVHWITDDICSSDPWVMGRAKDHSKKVLLCEHKRHTVCRVSSTPSAVLSRGVPHLWSGRYPSLNKGGTPSLDREVLQPWLGYFPFWPETGVPPPPGCGETENITFPILRMRAVKIVWTFPP